MTDDIERRDDGVIPALDEYMREALCRMVGGTVADGLYEAVCALVRTSELEPKDALRVLAEVAGAALGQSSACINVVMPAAQVVEGYDPERHDFDRVILTIHATGRVDYTPARHAGTVPADAGGVH